MTSTSRFMALLSAMVLFSATALVGCFGEDAATTDTAAPATEAATEAAPAATPEAAAPAAAPEAAAPGSTVGGSVAN